MSLNLAVLPVTSLSAGCAPPRPSWCEILLSICQLLVYPLKTVPVLMCFSKQLLYVTFHPKIVILQEEKYYLIGKIQLLISNLVHRTLSNEQGGNEKYTIVTASNFKVCSSGCFESETLDLWCLSNFLHFSFCVLSYTERMLTKLLKH